ncbi:cell division protein FtsQ/DivIB [Fictibacillus terranigra]|uniref:Cell division protein DivIB n=1 Tax=Fictibacillus terranigra TaxID=3058424 RepID=A0ABT8E6J7_9BACL|nr:FtsQ-type POTRA domain-containing protein [Fictibacillus sp. CENA-BCM004]MDN4073532.1 FtsQ-type POTRA domain-containing protein [Fictibacillus sp. CENA-BCM004]
MDKDKVVTIEDRIPKLKTQRKQKTNRRMIIYLSLFFLLILIFVYFQSGFSHIKKITVSGNENISDQAIIEAGKISAQSSFLNLSDVDIQKNILRMGEISSVDVHKKFYNHLLIEVKEYHRVGYLKDKGKYYPVLESGKLLKGIEKDSLPVNAPIIMDWKDRKLLKPMANELGKLTQGIVHRISEIHLDQESKDANRIILYMTDGYEVRSSITHFARKMESYPSIVQQLGPHRKGVINMDVSTYFHEFGNEEAPKSETDR